MDGKSPNFLKTAQRFRLMEWIRSNFDRIKTSRFSTRETAAKAAAELGFPVSVGNVGGIIGMAKGTAIKYRWPSTSTPNPILPGLRPMSKPNEIEDMIREIHAAVCGPRQADQ